MTFSVGLKPTLWWKGRGETTLAKATSYFKRWEQWEVNSRTGERRTCVLFLSLGWRTPMSLPTLRHWETEGGHLPSVGYIVLRRYPDSVGTATSDLTPFPDWLDNCTVVGSPTSATLIFSINRTMLWGRSRSPSGRGDRPVVTQEECRRTDQVVVRDVPRVGWGVVPDSSVDVTDTLGGRSRVRSTPGRSTHRSRGGLHSARFPGSF